MTKIRIWYEKTGRAKYVSHLDMNRCMQRAVRRAGIPAWTTEGFHPHVYLTFALPLSLGLESVCEIMDFKLTEEMPFEEVVSRFNEHLPDGLHVKKAAVPVLKPEHIALARFAVMLSVQDMEGDETARAFRKFLEQEQIPVKKKTKKRELELNLKEYLEVDEIEGGAQGLRFTAVLPAGGSFNLNPSLLLDAFSAFVQRPFAQTHVTRTACLTETREDFA